jgi:hypothetical protein
LNLWPLARDLRAEGQGGEAAGKETVMKTMGKWAMGVAAVVFSVGVLADGAMAEGYIVGDNGVIIKAPRGGQTTISRDRGTTWTPYKVPPRPPKLQPVPQAPHQKCDFYQCSGNIVAVPAGTPGPKPGLNVGSGTIDGRRVNPKTNVLR